MNTPAPDTDTDRTPAPDSNSRQPPDPLLVTTTLSEAIDRLVVRNPATVAYAGTGAPSDTFNKNALPFSIIDHLPPFKFHRHARNGENDIRSLDAHRYPS